MSNPIFNALNNSPVNNQLAGFINELNQFKQTFSGDPKAEVQKLLNNGQLSQNQFNQYAQMANHIMAMMPK